MITDIHFLPNGSINFTRDDGPAYSLPSTGEVCQPFDPMTFTVMVLATHVKSLTERVHALEAAQQTVKN